MHEPTFWACSCLFKALYKDKWAKSMIRLLRIIQYITDGLVDSVQDYGSLRHGFESNIDRVQNVSKNEIR